MGAIMERGAALVRAVASRFSVRVERGPIADVAGVERFVATRAAFVTQKKLYGYLKTRMGTRFPSMFENDTFVASINIAKMHVFAASLSDLSVHAVAQLSQGALAEPEQKTRLAARCHAGGIADNIAHAPDADAAAEWARAFAERLGGVNWENVAAGGDAFTESPKALVHWAPIADSLKRHDREIVENSIRFAWNEVVRDYGRRIDPAAVAADWARPGGG